MSARLKTELEWENAGYAIIPGERSEHRNKWGEALFRPDQVEVPYYEDEEDIDFNGYPIEGIESTA